MVVINLVSTVTFSIDFVQFLLLCIFWNDTCRRPIIMQYLYLTAFLLVLVFSSYCCFKQFVYELPKILQAVQVQEI